MIVCLCNRVSDRDIRQAVQVHGVHDFEVLKDLTRVASCCGCCHDCAREVFDEAVAGPVHRLQQAVLPSSAA